MKTLLTMITIAMLSFGGSLAHADADSGTGRFAIGPQGGVVFPNWSFKNTTVNTSNDNGYLAGVFAELGIWALTLRPEANYVEKGYTITNVAQVKHRYLELDALLKFNPFNASVVSPFILVGPSWSKHLSEKVTPIVGASSTYTDNADKWDLAGVAGAGIEFNLSEHVGLQLQARYNFGFRNISSSSTEIKSRGLYAMGGLAFTL